MCEFCATAFYPLLNEPQLAHYLQALGVKADSFVGICVQRSPERCPELVEGMMSGMFA